MEFSATDSIAPLIESGQLLLGQVLTCPVAGINAVVTSEGLAIHDFTTMDPTEAMRHVLSVKTDHDNGWIFWKQFDPVRGFTKPLEHVRAEWKAKQLPSDTRTSRTHPLRINTLSIPGIPGRIGMTFCPGKKSDAFYRGAWDRSLDLDLTVINAWGAKAVVTVMEDEEFGLLGIPDFPLVMGEQPFKWFHLQIKDSDIPDDRFEQAWPKIKQELVDMINAGDGIVVHCRGGLGRTGVVVSLLLIEMGIPSESAILMVRKARPGAIETWEQESYVRAFA